MVRQWRLGADSPLTPERRTLQARIVGPFQVDAGGQRISADVLADRKCLLQAGDAFISSVAVPAVGLAGSFQAACLFQVWGGCISGSPGGLSSSEEACKRRRML
jgi:hypothetical protein